MATLHLEVPDKIMANRLKALAGHDKQAHLFQRLRPHKRTDKCRCFGCEHAVYFKALPSWAGKRKPWAGLYRWVRFIGTTNSPLRPEPGEQFVAVAACDVDEWYAELCRRYDRIGMLMALRFYFDKYGVRREAARQAAEAEREAAKDAA